MLRDFLWLTHSVLLGFPNKPCTFWGCRIVGGNWPKGKLPPELWSLLPPHNKHGPWDGWHHLQMVCCLIHCTQKSVISCDNGNRTWTQNLWNWVCCRIVLLICSPIFPYPSYVWARGRKIWERTWSNTWKLAFLGIFWVMELKPKTRKTNMPPPNLSRHRPPPILQNEIPHSWVYLYATVSLVSWLTGPLLVAGPVGRISSNSKMSLWQQIW